MADVSMKDFLLQYYMQKHFNAMPEEQFAQYTEYLGADDFRGNMKSWRDKGLVTRLPNGVWTKNRNFPDPNDAGGNFHLTDEEWENLFNAFQSAFQKMSVDKATLATENPKAKKLLDQYFGDATGKLFSNTVASQLADDEIQQVLLPFLQGNDLSIPLSQWGITDKDFSYSKFVTGLSTKKYNTSPEFQEKLKEVVRYLNYYRNTDSLQQQIGGQIPQFSHIQDGFDNNAVPPAKLDLFKANDYRVLLDELYSNGKFQDAFRQYDNTITKNIDKAKEKVDYEDGKGSYIPAKRTDELTWWQNFSKNISDTWSDYMDKYTTLNGDRLYFSDSAKMIVKELPKAKFKTTDGLGKLLDGAKNIENSLMYKSPRATDHFSWMAKTLSELKSTMPKAFDGALKNGAQMRALISELIVKAVKDNKIDEAKTAMEVLSVIKYGYTTSKIMDAIKNEKLSLFSDKSLSWNKNEGIQMVTNAMDTCLSVAFKTVGYGVTMFGNAIKLNGSKFNHRTQHGKSKALQNARNNWVAQDAAARQAQADSNSAYEIFANGQIADNDNIINNINNTRSAAGSPVIDAGNYDALLQNMRDEHSLIEQDKSQPAYRTASQHVQQANELTNARTQLMAQRRDIRRLKRQIAKEIAAVNGNTTMTDKEKDQRIARLVDYDMQQDDRLKEIKPQLTAINSQLNAITKRNPNWANEQTMVRDISDREQRNAVDSAELEQWKSATDANTELTQNMQKNQETLDNWSQEHNDNFQLLMGYWDMLESKRDTHFGKMYNFWFGSAKAKQKAFKNKRTRLITNATNNYQVIR